MPRKAWTEPSLRPDRTPLSTRTSGSGFVGGTAALPAGARPPTATTVAIMDNHWGTGIISRGSAGIRRLARGSSEIGTPGSPIISRPSLGYACEVAVGDIDMGKLDSAAALV